MDQGSKTEPATPRQRQRARQRGQVARSVELVSALMLFAGFMMLFMLDEYTGHKFIDYFQRTAGQADRIELSPSTVYAFASTNVAAVLGILTPYLLITTLVVLIVNFAQVGLVFASKPLAPDLGRLNPLKGFQRIFSMRGMVELVKNLLKLMMVAFIAGTVISKLWPGILSGIAMSPFSAIDFAQSVAMKIALFCCALLLILAILDYIYQKYEFEKSIRMTKQEIRDEYKNQEGDPQIKRRIREMGRRIAMSRMFEQLQTADAVITNPTHYAVAVVYELEWPAPKVVAKGTDYMALRIIRYAEELGLPVYQQPDLARALFKVELDDFVPANLFKAVARVLAHLSRHDAKLRKKFRGVRSSTPPLTTARPAASTAGGSAHVAPTPGSPRR
ncbi:flagellar biosynthesis protein FlhB [bacterium]|nr:flagellar biosynthesis protein FlhB [bacterium]